MARAHQVPDVDDRLQDAKRALATLILITRALSQARDLGLNEEIEQWAWCGVGGLAQDGYDAVNAVYEALPDLTTPAPAKSALTP